MSSTFGFPVYQDENAAIVEARKHKRDYDGSAVASAAQGRRPVLGDVSNAMDCNATGQSHKKQRMNNGEGIAVGWPSESPVPMSVERPITTRRQSLSTSTEPARLNDFHSDVRLDPVWCCEYIDDILDYLSTREADARIMPQNGYMRRQRDINPEMRSILIDWLVDVGEEFKLQPETLFLTANFLDRFLSEIKFEEIYVPEIDQFVGISDNTYKRDEIVRMERVVLRTLRFEMSAVTPRVFARLFFKAAGISDDDTQWLAYFLAELSLLDDGFLAFRPSKIMGAAIAIALSTVGRPHWSAVCDPPNNNVKPASIERYTSMSVGDLRACAHRLHGHFVACPTATHVAVREKYSQPKFGRVAARYRASRVLPF